MKKFNYLDFLNFIFFRHFFNCQISKKCIPFYQHCDGYKDCIFNEDEINCQDLCNKSTSFRCSTNEKCITKDDLCNNITDCLNNEDEHDIICGHFCEWPSLNTCSSMKIKRNDFEFKKKKYFDLF